MVRYPLGGMMSYVLQYLVGFQRLGHDVYFAEKAGYPNSCYDPVRNVMSDDCAYGAEAVNAPPRQVRTAGSVVFRRRARSVTMASPAPVSRMYSERPISFSTWARTAPGWARRVAASAFSSTASPASPR